MVHCGEKGSEEDLVTKISYEAAMLLWGEGSSPIRILSLLLFKLEECGLKAGNVLKLWKLRMVE